jgi:Signal transduction histidine kinase
MRPGLATSLRRERYFIAAFIALSLCSASAALAYWLLAALRLAPRGELASYLSVSVLSSVLIMGTLILLVAMNGARLTTRRRSVLSILSEAMAQIAEGDFETGLPESLKGRDFSEKLAVDGMRAMTEALRNLDDMRTRFVSDVSHEIRSPLASIRGFAQILKDEGLPPDRRRAYLDIIEAESVRLSRLGDDLLKLSALDSKAQAVERSAYRLDAQLRSALVACEPQWSGKGLEVEAELESVEVEADEALLGLVWGNLLGNAIKFTQAGGRIALRCRSSEDSAVVRCSDTGIGIAPEDLPFVFDRFYKADRSRGSGEGSGLGLAIAKTIVELHGGLLRVESAGLGKGAAFEATLPLRAPLKGAP